MTHGFYEEARASEAFMSADGLLDVVFKFIICFHVGQDCTLLTRCAKNILNLQLRSTIRSTVSFHFGTVMRIHFFATVCWLGLKCSTRGSQATGV